jgi:hypothetical protein
MCPAARLVAATETNPTYQELRAARPKGDAVAVQNLTIERDVYKFHFDSGSFQFVTLADGRAAGAVFVGDGGYELKPAIEAERRQLALETGEKGLEVLSDRFDSAVLLFTDGTAAEIKQKSSAAAASPRFAEVFDAFFKKQRKDIKSNLQLRLLQDLLATPAPTGGVFMAYIPGKKYPAGLALLDPLGLDWFAPILAGGEEVGFYAISESETGLWYLAHRKGAASPPPARAARALHYAVETTIKANAEIQGTTVVFVRPPAAGERVLRLNLLGKLRLGEAGTSDSEAGPWKAAAVIQEAVEEDSDAAVVLAAPPTPGKSFFLRLVYEGKDVLHDSGDGNFIVGARESWYPNLGVFTELSPFDLTYRCPKTYDVVSVGKRTDNRVAGDTRVSVWKVERPIRVAGFNYGKFKKIERDDKDSQAHIEVYTNTGTPDIIGTLNAILARRQRRRSSAVDPNAAGIVSGISTEDIGVSFDSIHAAGLSAVHVDVDTLADSAMADAINTARIGNLYFGPLPDGHVAITQQTQFFFGQSWPSLIYLPYIAAFDVTTRRELGLKDIDDFVEEVGPHEFAHQWWGHLVGWQSYRDQWLSEGFAEFSAALWLQRTAGAKRFVDFWEKTRKWILARPQQSALFNCEAGPITQGIRLSTKRSPYAYQAMVYGKGAYVLHMLRQMMREHTADPDARFIALMKDFASSYAGANPSTHDFQKVVERHMTPAMNVKGDGKMDWFFRQWVDGTEIPRYRTKLDVAPVSKDQYKISGSVAQEGVSADFWSLAQVYVEFPKGEVAHLGTLSLVGTATTPVDVTVKLSKAPKRIVLNALHDVLSLD